MSDDKQQKQKAAEQSLATDKQGAGTLQSTRNTTTAVLNIGDMAISKQEADDKVDMVVIKLGTEPYVSWKKQMMNVLKSKGLEAAITEENYRLNNRVKESLAQTILYSSLDKTNRLNCIDCDTAKEIWDRLSSLHEVKTAFETQDLFIKLNNYRMTSAARAAESIAEIRYIAAKLKTLGEQISENNLMSVILRALPKSLRHIQLSWKTIAATDRNLTNLVSFILSEAADGEKVDDVALIAKYSYKSDGDLANQGFRSNRRKNDQCYYCKQFGHWARDCDKRRAGYSVNDDNDSSSDDDSTDEHLEKDARKMNRALVAKVKKMVATEWIVDSDSTVHVAHSAEWFKSLEKLEDGFNEIIIGGSNILKAVGVGTIQTEVGLLTDVYLVPDMRCNLYSIKSSVEHGNKLIFDKDGLSIYGDEEIILDGYHDDMVDSLYKINLNILIPESSIMPLDDESDTDSDQNNGSNDRSDDEDAINVWN